VRSLVDILTKQIFSHPYFFDFFYILGNCCITRHMRDNRELNFLNKFAAFSRYILSGTQDILFGI